MNIFITLAILCVVLYLNHKFLSISGYVLLSVFLLYLATIVIGVYINPALIFAALPFLLLYAIALLAAVGSWARKTSIENGTYEENFVTKHPIITGVVGGYLLAGGAKDIKDKLKEENLSLTVQRF